MTRRCGRLRRLALESLRGASASLLGVGLLFGCHPQGSPGPAEAELRAPPIATPTLPLPVGSGSAPEDDAARSGDETPDPDADQALHSGPPASEPAPSGGSSVSRSLSDPFGTGRHEDAAPDGLRADLPDDLSLRLLDEASAEGPAVPMSTLRPQLPAMARELLDQDGDEAARRSVALGDGTPWSLLHERWGAVESTLFVVDHAGRVRSATTFRNRVAMLALADLWGDAALEVVVEVIEGTALSSWPRRWEFYRLTPAGRLAFAGSLAKAYDYGAKSPSLYFHNTVTLPAKGTLRVETTVFHERGPEPPRGAPRGAAEVFELRWDPKTQRLRRHAAGATPTG